MFYRPEIDGLRAIAVVPVILFHAGVSIFGGGFVGVDVFFVISGYLITTILLKDLRDDKFSILRFYERRARRILPALFLVIAFCIPFAYAWMIPQDFRSFSRSIVAVVFFASNILFWREEGYFAATSENKPLLHTWSLAVEEQFYIVFPIILLLLWKFARRRTVIVFAVIACASLALAEWGWRYAPNANFYLAPFRAWELLAGSLCAFFLIEREVRSNQWLSALGLALIGWSVFAFDDSTPFPSVYGLAPIGGAALIILFAGPDTWVRKLLSRREFVGVGLISYSAYLWHQPLFAFARLRNVGDPPIALLLGLGALSLGLAYLSWRFVENPFRNSRSGPLTARWRVFAVSAAGMAILFLVGLGGEIGKGLPGRIAPSGVSFAEAVDTARFDPNFGLSSECEGEFTLAPACRTSDTPDIILWGDSYAMHLGQALLASPSVPGMLQLTKSQCSPVPGVATIASLTPWRECMRFNDQALQFILSSKSAKTVVISSPFNLIDPRRTIYLRDGTAITSDQSRIVAEHLQQLDRTLAAKGKRLVVVTPPPATGEDIGQCLLRASAFGAEASSCNFREGDITESVLQTDRMLVSALPREQVVSLDKIMCTDGWCRASADQTFLYRDRGHLSIEGAQYLGNTFDLAAMVEGRQR